MQVTLQNRVIFPGLADGMIMLLVGYPGGYPDDTVGGVPVCTSIQAMYTVCMVQRCAQPYTPGSSGAQVSMCAHTLTGCVHTCSRDEGRT